MTKKKTEETSAEETTLLSFVKEVHEVVKRGEAVAPSIGGDIARERAKRGLDALAEAEEYFIEALIQDK